MTKSGEVEPLFRLVWIAPSVRYALSAVTYLATKHDQRFCMAGEAARRQGLPADFLAKIFQKLTHAGILTSRHGPGGGYALAKPAGRISLIEIMRAADEGLGNHRDCLFEFHACGNSNPCLMHKAVTQAERVLSRAIGHLTLADVIENRGYLKLRREE